MFNALTLTIISVVVVTVIAAFVRGRRKDKCLKDFAGSLLTLQNTSDKLVWGRLRVESTGIELLYRHPHKDNEGHNETSYILYKQEYSTLKALIRYYDELDDEAMERREIELEKTYHPSTLRKLRRRIRNFLNTFRNSVIEIVNLFVGQVKKTGPGGRMLAGQDKHISQLQQELGPASGTAYEPLLEPHIGKKVVLELIEGDKVIEYSCILKEYTAEFIEVMDSNYRIKEGEPVRRADLVVPRKYGVIRHLGE